MYDYIIIGAGMSGLYFAYKYLNNNHKFIILEKREYIGGRTVSHDFHGTNIPLGASVVEDNNTHILKLINNFKLSLTTSKTPVEFQYPNVTAQDLEQMKSHLEKVYEKNKEEIKKNKFSIDDFLKIYFDPHFYHKLKNVCDYTDFFHNDVDNFIKKYPIDDLFTPEENFHTIKGGWISLINVFLEKIKDKIILNERVLEIKKEIKKESGQINVQTNNNLYQTKKIILCGDLSIKKIKYIGFNKKLNEILNQIGSVPYIRIYTYHDKIDVKAIVRTMTILHKIIPFNENILMSSYADSEDAITLYKYLKLYDKKEFAAILNKLIKESLPIKYRVTDTKDIILRYWKHGVHYIKPFNKSDLFDQTELNKEGLMLCGEMMSNRLGWVEGAIQNVDDSQDRFNLYMKI